MIQRSDDSMHRLKDNGNDWDNIPDTDLTRLQRVAKWSKGVVTAANMITIAGSVSVINGIMDFVNGNKIEGTAKVLVGRAADVIDGAVADKTHTKGRVGRDLDPTADTVQLAAALYLMEGRVIPLAATLAIATPKAVGVVGSLAARARNVELNPTAEGKLGAAALWLGVGSFMLKGALEKHAPGFVDAGLETLGWGASLAGAGLSVPAASEYASAGFGKYKSEV